MRELINPIGNRLVISPRIVVIIYKNDLLHLLPQIMGLLSLGTPLDWDQAKSFADHVRSHGIDQFANTWRHLKDRHGDELLWGDEVLPTRSLARLSAMATHSRPTLGRVHGRTT
jgi:hypothetical protein